MLLIGTGTNILLFISPTLIKQLMNSFLISAEKHLSHYIVYEIYKSLSPIINQILTEPSLL